MPLGNAIEDEEREKDRFYSGMLCRSNVKQRKKMENRKGIAHFSALNKMQGEKN
jgi:hypothetical protein